jgi:hypothetical protein
MKLSFVFEEDEEVLVGPGEIAKPLARVTLAVARTDGSGKIVLTREFRDEFGPKEKSISFEASEQEILKNHVDELLEFLKNESGSDDKRH